MTTRPITLPLPSDLGHYEALICMWLGSDPPLLERARGEFDPHPDDDAAEYDGAQLGAWVGDLLYDAYYGASNFPDLYWVTEFGGDKSKAFAARGSVPEDKLFSISDPGWVRIGKALIA